MAETKKVNATIETKGDAFVITAGFKLNTINNLKKYGKEAALQLVDAETKDTYFSVNADKCGSYSKYGITFTGANKDGLAEVTGIFPENSMTSEKKKEYIKDEFALVIANLNKIQEQVEKASGELDGVMKTVEASITVG